MGFGIVVLLITLALVVAAAVALHRRRESNVRTHPPEDTTQDPDRP